MDERERFFRLCERWVDAEWVAVAGAAWRHHMRAGAKGAIEIKVDDIAAIGKRTATQFFTDYRVALGQADVDAAIEKHDPSRQVVVIFVKGEDSWLYVASHDPPPPEAHRALAH